MFIADSTNAGLVLNSVPETLALLIFGVCLVGATVGLRRLLKRHDEAQKTEKNLPGKQSAKHKTA